MSNEKGMKIILIVRLIKEILNEILSMKFFKLIFLNEFCKLNLKTKFSKCNLLNEGCKRSLLNEIL